MRLLLVFLHLLGMAVLVGSFLVQRRATTDGPPNAGWLHGAGLQLVTGLALQLLAPATDAEYNNMKLGIKLLVLLVIGGLALTFTLRKTTPSWLNPTLGGLVVLNVGLAVFWT
ncbi:hypothetical protein [Actinophytocola sediminis]